MVGMSVDEGVDLIMALIPNAPDPDTQKLRKTLRIEVKKILSAVHFTGYCAGSDDERYSYESYYE